MQRVEAGLKRIPMYVLQTILIGKRNRVLRMHIRDDMKVIGDFGCGHFANKHATVLVDRFGTGDEQRGGFGITKRAAGRTVHDVDLNVFPYPFADNEFDYLICTHALEHLDDPVRSCAEFSRIARAGYIEVPHGCVDILIRNNDAIHRWLCSYDAEVDVIRFLDRKRMIEVQQPFTFSVFLRFLLQLRSVCVPWTGGIAAEYVSMPPEGGPLA